MIDSELVDLVVRVLRIVQHIEGDGAVAAAAVLNARIGTNFQSPSAENVVTLADRRG
jgi:hypothetical protein